jgi:hypothetical protein
MSFPSEPIAPGARANVDRHLHRLSLAIGEIHSWHQQDWNTIELVLWRQGVREGLDAVGALLEHGDD